MKILVISDSHGASEYIVEAISRNKDAGAIAFLGDGERDLEEALADCNISPYGDDGSMEVYQVRGNCDRFSMEPALLTFTAGGHKILITHGNDQGVKYGPEKLILTAEQRKCDAAFFGHTHRAELLNENGIFLFNPGSIRTGSYGVVFADENGMRFELKNVHSFLK